MTFIAMIIALAVEIFASHLQYHKPHDWFPRYFGWCRGVLPDSPVWNGTIGVVLLLTGPVLLLILVQDQLAGIWFGLFSLILATGVLYFCLAFHQLDQWVDQISDAIDNDEQGQAWALVGELLGDSPDDHPKTLRIVAESVFFRANERLFGILFWFILLGPVGALLYYLSRILKEYRPQSQLFGDEFNNSAERLFVILSWVPARLAALTFAMVGNFEGATHAWNNIERPLSLEGSNEQVLGEVGSGAMQIERYESGPDSADLPEQSVTLESTAVRAARGLVLRALLVWCIFVACFSLAGWGG